MRGLSRGLEQSLDSAAFTPALLHQRIDNIVRLLSGVVGERGDDDGVQYGVHSGSLRIEAQTVHGSERRMGKGRGVIMW